MTDFEDFSALSHVPQHNNNTVHSNSSLSASENPQVDDEDSYADTEPDFDDDQELSELAQRQLSAFHAAMSHEVHHNFFFWAQTQVNFCRGHLGKNQQVVLVPLHRWMK